MSIKRKFLVIPACLQSCLFKAFFKSFFMPGRSDGNHLLHFLCR
jgi:hypothetical protein